jgi:hypothetical protein
MLDNILSTQHRRALSFCPSLNIFSNTSYFNPHAHRARALFSFLNLFLSNKTSEIYSYDCLAHIKISAQRALSFCPRSIKLWLNFSLSLVLEQDFEKKLHRRAMRQKLCM